METSRDTIPTLPSVEYTRTKRTFRRTPQTFGYSFLDVLKYYTATDPDLIWGPFYNRVRAARHNARNSKSGWAPFGLSTIWAGIPETVQTRPGAIVGFVNWLTGNDPRPSLTPPPSGTWGTTRSSTSTEPRTTVESWQREVMSKEDWSPSRIDFTEWYGRLKHPADYDDDFYRTNYRTLYNKICEVADTWFGADVRLEDLRDTKEEISAWQVPMTEQFIEYARLVAHEDSGYVEWNEILNDPRHRKWLCVGILAQIIEKKIFSSLLFGASDPFSAELDRHDTHWAFQEGFTRKEGRRQIARAAVGTELVPDRFWDSVDMLAGQTVLIFQPLLSLVALGSGRSSGPQQASFYQEIHTILAMAGYFQVCMAISPSIFHILSASPGSRFQWEEEAHADSTIYQHSKGFHQSHEDRWRVIAELSSNNQNSTVTKIVESMGDLEDSSQYQPFPVNENEYRLMDHQRRRGGKVMYAVFPKLTRYTAENIGELILDIKPALTREIQETGEGTRINILSRCMVVYYQGLIHAEADDGTSLDQHLQEILWKRMSGGILPYCRYYWLENGRAAYSLDWPLWPSYVDTYWLSWGLWVLVYSFFWKNIMASTPASADGNWFTAFLWQASVWFLAELGFYHLLLKAPWSFFNKGNWLFVKVRILSFAMAKVTQALLASMNEDLYLLSILAVPFVWLDKILLNTLPRVVMTMAGVIDNEDAPTVLARLFSRNATTSG
ncbi:hypothetical protein F5B22DRAFT_541426 [Xylaria bambusicola]|uniref:uncharacterized protein n=1 Tax=Xylaria bambusicola TaxID=326684 RepID=UPI002008CF6D|nr:uncharacterized protein F5B22DRAFT_541426 [Xylaria bambusicola]KAI0521532.1 hypothetical protein F5B22DRAFT_541426 [Xylaria bambusicola]